MTVDMNPDVHLTAIYIVWGASSFILAAALATLVLRATRLQIVRGFGLMALSAMMHGFKELSDLYHHLHPAHPDQLEAVFLGTSAALLLVSFALLFQGAMTLLLLKSDRAFLRFTPWVILSLLQLVLLALGRSTPQDTETVGRLALGLPAFAAAASAMTLFGWRSRVVDRLPLTIGAYGAALGFFLLGVLVGIHVPTIAGIPVQAFRAACSLLCSCSVVIMLVGFWAPPRS